MMGVSFPYEKTTRKTRCFRFLSFVQTDKQNVCNNFCVPVMLHILIKTVIFLYHGTSLSKLTKKATPSSPVVP